VGGGVGGLHTAFRLGPQLNKVCLFEKEDRLGGRVYDVSRDPDGEIGLDYLRQM
jgi:phytoene dehydrogenase-like protein